MTDEAKKAASQPWVFGAVELIRHAEGHRSAGTDLDKQRARLAGTLVVMSSYGEGLAGTLVVMSSYGEEDE